MTRPNEHHDTITAGLRIVTERPNGDGTYSPVDAPNATSPGGTISIIAKDRDGNAVLVTNAHVVTGEHHHNPAGGERLYHHEISPGRHIATVPQWDENNPAWVERIERLDNPHRLDVCYAVLESGVDVKFALHGHDALNLPGETIEATNVHAYRRIIPGTYDPAVGDKLVFLGRNSGEHEVTVIDTNSTEQVLGFGFTGLVTVSSTTDLISGDSGAGLYKKVGDEYQLSCIFFANYKRNFIVDRRKGQAFRASEIVDPLDLTFYNSDPVADAGQPQEVRPLTTVTLNGSASYDPDTTDTDMGRTLTYHWEQVPTDGAPTVNIRKRDQAEAEFESLSSASELEFMLTVKDAFGGVGTATTNVTVRNRPPVAIAGYNQVVAAGSKVELTGASISDEDPEDRDRVTPLWSQKSGTKVTLKGTGLNGRYFTAPTTPGDLIFELKATDPYGLMHTDEVRVRVSEFAVLPTNVSATAAARSVDISWNSVSIATGYEVEIGIPPSEGGLNHNFHTTTSTSITIGSLLPRTTYEYRVRMTNADGVGPWTAWATVDTKSPPIALAGPDKLITAGHRVTLEGSVSDPDPSDREYVVENHSWTQDEDNPATVTLARVEGYPARRTFTPTMTGDYTFTLAVTDPGGLSHSDTMKVKAVRESENLLPTNVSARPGYRSVDISWNSVSLATGYEVQVGVAEDGGEIGYASYTTTALTHRVENLADGTRYYYRVRMTNADGVGPWSAVASTVTAVPANYIPVANAGADQTVETGASVTLDGSGSRDWDGDDLTYAWKQVKGPKVTLSGADSVRATFTAPSSAATLRFRLTVTDSDGDSDIDAVIITVTAPKPPPETDPPPTTEPDPCTAPANVTATATANSVTVSWDAVSGATGYDVQLGVIEEGDEIGYSSYSTTNLTYTVSNLASNTRHYYRVRARNNDGPCPWSAAASLATPPMTCEDTGETRNVVNGDWTDTGRVQQDPVDDSWEKEQTRTVTWEKEQRCTNCAAGTPNKWVEASRTEIQWVAYTPPPSTPTNVTATSTHNSVTVSWRAASGATGYILQLGELEEDEEIGYANYTTTGLTRTVSNLKSRTRYYYRVKSTNSGGESSPSVAASLLTKAPPPPPPTHVWTWVDPAEYTGCGPTRKRRKECSNGHARHTKLVSASEKLIWSEWSDTGDTRNSGIGSWRDDGNTRDCGPDKEKRQRRTISREKEQESTNQCGGRKTQWVSTTSRTETQWVAAPESLIWDDWKNVGQPVIVYGSWTNVGSPSLIAGTCKQRQKRTWTRSQRQESTNQCGGTRFNSVTTEGTTYRYDTVTETWGSWTDTGRTREDPITFIVEYEQERFSSPCNRRQTRWLPETG